MLRFITNIVFIKIFGLIGAGYSTLFVYIVIFALNTYFIWKTIPFKIWDRNVSAMVLSSIIMGAIIGIPTLFFQIDEWSRTKAMGYSVLAIIVGALVYFALLVIMKAIKLEDLANLPFINKIIKKTDSVKSEVNQKRGKGEIK